MQGGCSECCAFKHRQVRSMSLMVFLTELPLTHAYTHAHPHTHTHRGALSSWRSSSRGKAASQAACAGSSSAQGGCGTVEGEEAAPGSTRSTATQARLHAAPRRRWRQDCVIACAVTRNHRQQSTAARGGTKCRNGGCSTTTATTFTVSMSEVAQTSTCS